MGVDASQKTLLPIFLQLSEPQRNRALFVDLPPTLYFVFLSDLVLYLTLHADGAGAHALSVGWRMRPGAMEEPLFDAPKTMNMTAAMEITAQDLHVDDLGLMGLQSRFASRGRYGWPEPAAVG